MDITEAGKLKVFHTFLAIVVGDKTKSFAFRINLKN